MASVWRSALLAALLALALAATAQAHTLKVPRTAKANRTFAKLVCGAANEGGEATCLASRPGACRRLSRHRVRCSFFLTLEFEDGARNRCRSMIDWTVRRNSPRLRPNYLGVRSCTQLRPPTEEVPPAAS